MPSIYLLKTISNRMEMKRLRCAEVRIELRALVLMSLIVGRAFYLGVNYGTLVSFHDIYTKCLRYHAIARQERDVTFRSYSVSCASFQVRQTIMRVAHKPSL